MFKIGIYFGNHLIKATMKYFYLSVIFTLTSLICLANDTAADLNVKINKDEQNWFWSTPWIWVGTAIFMYLFVTITRDGGLGSRKP